MSKTDENFTGQTSSADNFDDTIRKIREAWARQNPAILETAKLLHDAWETFPGQQKEMADLLNMSASELSMLLTISECRLLYYPAHLEMLPPGLTPLHGLTMIERLGEAFRDGAITRNLTRQQIRELRDRYSTSQTPQMDSPSIAGGEDAMASHSARKPRTVKPPKGMFAVIEMPKSQSQLSAVMQAIESLRTAGLVVHDAWSLDEKKQGELMGRDENEITKEIVKTVRKKVTKLRADYKKKRKLHKFHETFGKEEIQVSDLDDARRVYGLIEHEAEFDRLVEDVRRTHDARDFVPLVPHFPDESDMSDPRAVLDRFKPKRDFSKMIFD